MITLNQTAGNDNELIFVFRLEYENTAILMSTQAELELGASEYSAIVQKESISRVTSTVSIFSGGNIGSVQSLSLKIIRWGGFYVGDFYPTASAPYLTGGKLRAGFVWQGATTESEITWFYEGYVRDYSAEHNGLRIESYEINDIDTVQMPLYSIQKDLSDGISYYPNAPDGNVGAVIPVLYGDFSKVLFTYSDVCLAPSLLVDKSKYIFIVCSHSVHTTTSYQVDATSREYMFKYIGSADCYISIYTDTKTAKDNNVCYYTVTTMNGAGEPVLGASFIQLKTVGGYSDVIDVTNATDKSSSTATAITGSLGGSNKLALKTAGSVNTSEFGQVNYAIGDITFNFLISNTGSITFKFGYYNYAVSPAAGWAAATVIGSYGTATTFTYQFGNRVTAKKSGTLPWDIEELTGLNYYVDNASTNAGLDPLSIYNAWIELRNIVVIGIEQTVKAPGFRVIR